MNVSVCNLRRQSLIFLIALLASGSAWCLGVGDIEVQSRLGEPFEAQLRLTNSGDLSKDQIIVRLASQDMYKRMDVERNYQVLSLKFAVEDNGVVTIKTHDPIKEPYLNFIIEVVWPEGQLNREYNVFLDPA